MFKNLTFSDEDNIIRYIMSEYSKGKLMDLEWSSNALLQQIDNILKSMKENELELFEREYVNNTNRDWWKCKYSKTTYYRHKKKIMRIFIDCLI